MPNVRQGGGYTLTFSKKNEDVRDLLADKKANEKGFIVTDYICKAIRFFEENKDKGNLIDIAQIKSEIIDSLNINELIKNELSKFSLVESKVNNLEDDLDEIPIDED
ncbi:hypothetical protein [Clostridium sp. B9]|uniref:hypothetical protein n=1 Tax=Clostridium sp. B9 TaxID=3423224 RepID=UPI003D2EDAF4